MSAADAGMAELDAAAVGNALCRDAGYQALAGATSLYRVYRDEVSWTEAESGCLASGGHLAVIETLEEHRVVGEMVGAINVWIGLSDREEEGNFVWVNAVPLEVGGEGYPPWGSGEPNNSVFPFGGQDCAQMRETDDMRWDDAGCDVDKAYVCECSM